MKKSFAGVYALFRGNEIVYVGESKDVYRRISNHTHGNGNSPSKNFDTWEYIEVENDYQRRRLEIALIHFFMPYYNKQWNRYGLLDLQFDDVKIIRTICRKIPWLYQSIQRKELIKPHKWRILPDVAC